jgi:excisionase family DNA binding protein
MTITIPSESANGASSKNQPAHTGKNFESNRRARRINAACEALDISRSHLYALAAKGKIKLIRIGGRTLVPESEIDRLVEEGV